MTLRLCLTFVVLLSCSTGCARTLYNFNAVEPEVLYRSAQPSPLMLRWATKRHGIRSIINLRGRTPGYESAFAAEHGLRLYHFNLSASRPPREEDIARFLALLRDPENLPAWVHCRSGVDRTGYMVAFFRMQEQGRTQESALHEMNRFLQFEWLNSVPQTVVKEGARSVNSRPTPP